MKLESLTVEQFNNKFNYENYTTTELINMIKNIEDCYSKKYIQDIINSRIFLFS